MTAGLRDRLGPAPIVPFGDEDPWSYLVASETVPGLRYRVDLAKRPDGTFTGRCECKSAEMRPAIECKHVRQVLAAVALKEELNMSHLATVPKSEDTPDKGTIHEAMAAIYGMVGYVQKDRRIESGPAKYSYAGEAAVIAAVRDAMVENQVTVRIVSVRDVVHEEIAIGSNSSRMQRTTLIATARFTHGPSGTHIDCEALGEGMDSGDKSSNKAMTGALKYALRQTFCLETGNDPDDSRPEHENGHQSAPAARSAAKPAQTGAEISEPGEAWRLLPKAMQSVGLVRADVLPVLEGDFSPGGIAAYFALDPAHTLGTLISAAQRLKGGN